MKCPGRDGGASGTSRPARTPRARRVLPAPRTTSNASKANGGVASRGRMATAEETHEAHFASMAPGVRERLERIQQEVERRVPGAQRCISYKMPAYRQRRVFFYFAAFKKHIGVYPPVTDDVALMEDSARFRGPKGNLSFPLNEALPLDLIGRVAEALSREYA